MNTLIAATFTLTLGAILIMVLGAIVIVGGSLLAVNKMSEDEVLREPNKTTSEPGLMRRVVSTKGIWMSALSLGVGLGLILMWAL